MYSATTASRHCSGRYPGSRTSNKLSMLIHLGRISFGNHRQILERVRRTLDVEGLVTSSGFWSMSSITIDNEVMRIRRQEHILHGMEGGNSGSRPKHTHSLSHYYKLSEPNGGSMYR